MDMIIAIIFISKIKYSVHFKLNLISHKLISRWTLEEEIISELNNLISLIS